MSQTDLEDVSGTGVITQKRGPTNVSWLIENYSANIESKHHIKSPSFYLSDKTIWWLQFFPNGEYDEDYVALYLMKSKSKKEYRYSCRLGILTPSESVLHSMCINCEFPKVNSACGSSTFLSKEIFMKAFGTETSSLKIFCIVRYSSEDVKDAGSLTTSPRSFASLSKDFKESYLSGRYSDLNLTVQGRLFQVHMFVLGSRSTVLAEMLDKEQKEPGSIRQISIEDCTADIFDTFLSFLYTDQLEDVLPSKLFELYKVANRFEVQELKKECLTKMLNSLTIDTFTDVVMTSVTFEESSLLSVAKTFYTENAPAILILPKWQKLVSDHSNVVKYFFEQFH